MSCCKQTQGDAQGGPRASSLPFSCSLWPDNRAQRERKDSDWTTSIRVIKYLLIQSCGFECKKAAEALSSHMCVYVPGLVPLLDSSQVFTTPRVGNWSTEIKWLPHQWWQPLKKPRFPASLFWVSTTGSANLSPACPPAPSRLLHTISRQWHQDCWAQAGQFPSVLLTSFSLPTQLTNF